MKDLHLPADITFNDLDFNCDIFTGSARVDQAVMQRFCLANDIDVRSLKLLSDALKVLHSWYVLHCEAGGRSDAMFELFEAKFTHSDTFRATIPPGIELANLKLSIDPANGLTMDTTELKRLLVANGIDYEPFVREPCMGTFDLIASWYRAHLALGKPADPAFENFLKDDTVRPVIRQMLTDALSQKNH